MTRHDRPRFVAFGIASLVNVLALLLYGLGLATHGRGGAAASLPLLVGLAFLNLLVFPWAAVKRGRDLGWTAGASLFATVGSLLFAPAVLFLAGYLAFAKGEPDANSFGPPPSAVTAVTWLNAIGMVLLPWIVLAIAARMLG